MACIVKSRRPNGVVYAYRSVSVWDPQKKMSIPKRQLIGRIDPSSGEIVPTGKRGKRISDTAQASSEEPVPKLDKLNEEISAIEEAIAGQQKQYQDVIEQIRESLVKMQTLKIDMKRSEAALDALIRAVQPLV